MSGEMPVHLEHGHLVRAEDFRELVVRQDLAQSPAPLGGGLVKAEWFKRYREHERPERFDRIVQSWDTANKATELSDFSVCTTSPVSFPQPTATAVP